MLKNFYKYDWFYRTCHTNFHLQIPETLYQHPVILRSLKMKTLVRSSLKGSPMILLWLASSPCEKLQPQTQFQMLTLTMIRCSFR